MLLIKYLLFIILRSWIRIKIFTHLPLACFYDTIFGIFKQISSCNNSSVDKALVNRYPEKSISTKSILKNTARYCSIFTTQI